MFFCGRRVASQRNVFQGAGSAQHSPCSSLNPSPGDLKVGGFGNLKGHNFGILMVFLQWALSTMSVGLQWDLWWKITGRWELAPKSKSGATERGLQLADWFWSHAQPPPGDPNDEQSDPPKSQTVCLHEEDTGLLKTGVMSFLRGQNVQSLNKFYLA